MNPLRLTPLLRQASRAAITAALLALAPARAADAADLKTTAMTLDPNKPERTELGRLTFLAGFQLTLDDARFGGFSGMVVTADGSSLTVVSDRGHWMRVALEHDASGRLTGLGDAAIRPLLDDAGAAREGRSGDAESLTPAPGGGFIVGMENRTGFALYAPALAAASAPLAGAQYVPAAPFNKGFEATVALGDGRVLALVEAGDGDGRHRGYVIGAAPPALELSYATERGYDPTDAALLPDGDVLVLERMYSLLMGANARIVLVRAADIQPGATLSGTEIARLSPPLTVDNMEALSVRAAPGGGGVLLYVMSDDNFSGLQRTLLLQFRLAE